MTWPTYKLNADWRYPWRAGPGLATNNSTRRKNAGFTLVELVIVVAIIGILAAVAYPSYLDSIRKARRADAGDAMLYIQSLQEKYRANNIDFGSLDEIGYGTSAVSWPSPDGYYTMTTTGAGSGSAYTITAVAVAGTTQAGDTSNPVNCTTLTLTVTAADPRGTRGPAGCWAN